MKKLSSSLTFFYKYVFLAVWSGGFGYGTLQVISSPAPGLPKYQFLIAWIVGTLFVYLVTGRLKKVQTDGHRFWISNYLKTVEVDVSDVVSVSCSFLVHPELVWFKLKQPSQFGKTIIFMPAARLSMGFTEHPVVKEIQELIDANHGAHRQ